MARRIPLAWLQLTREKLRLLVALAGVSFAVILVSMQLGFRGAVYDSAVRYHRHLHYDLVMVSPKTPFIGFPESFTRRRLYQVLGDAEVAGVTPVYIQQALWKNPWEFNSRNVLAFGFDPTSDVLSLPGVRRHLEALKLPDVAVFDATSRPEFGPVAEAVRQSGNLVAEVNDRRITIVGLFELGTSFGIDGSLVTSDLNFQRLFPDRSPGRIDLGLIHLVPGATPGAVRERLESALERDVLVLTRPAFIEREFEYWGSSTPIGYVFGFGAIMGLIVGGVIVYQILFADVSEHLAEYATLKAMGYTNRRLSRVVLQEAVILAAIGFVPGLGVTLALYRVTAQATRLPLVMTPDRALAVFALTLAMCGVAALMALRKVRSADPAEVFG
ncbi:MAG: ABC transporter permease DevC [Myxococcota bacterium]